MIVQALVLLLHFALFSFEGADNIPGLLGKQSLSKLSLHTFFLERKYAPLAQLVEQLTLNQWVPGSNP